MPVLLLPLSIASLNLRRTAYKYLCSVFAAVLSLVFTRWEVVSDSLIVGYNARCSL